MPFWWLPSISRARSSCAFRTADNNKRSSRQFSSLPLPPPGGAPPELVNPWPNPLQEGSIQAASHPRRPSHLSESDDALLAYMTTTDGDSVIEESPPNTAPPFSVPPATSTTMTTTLLTPTTNYKDRSFRSTSEVWDYRRR
ncbi:hypothetical protein BYT27DRAFT_6652912 [Phlegmacium glaucopus]|nr:hypothetical protein BYT27DRAFT_6652912 [Phlegmacium glaucopus]